MALGRDLKIIAGIIAVIAIFTALQLAAAVFAPLALGLFIIAIVWPLQSRLTALHFPPLLALLITILVTVATVLAFTLLFTWGFGRVGRSLILDAGRYQEMYNQAVAWLDGRGISTVGLSAENFNLAWLARMAQQITARLNTTLSFWVIALLYVILGLLEVDDMYRKVQALKNRDAAQILLDGTKLTAIKFRRYMLVRTLMSFATGLLVCLLAAVTGLQFAVEWGVIAFVLNYIPVIGPFVATLFPTLFAMAHFESWQAVLGLFVGLNMIQFVVGSYIEPRVAGTTLSISPFVVLFSVFFWTYMWGMFGAFIGVPVTIAVLTFCAQHPSSRWISDLIGTPEKAKNASEPKRL